MLSPGPLVLLVVCWGLGQAVSPPGTRAASLCDLQVCKCPNGALIHCVCDNKLQEIVLQANGATYLPLTVGSITIEKCLKVRVASQSIKNVRPLRRVTLSNIAQLDLEVEAFSWDGTVKPFESHTDPGIDISLINSTMPVIPTDSFRGHINSITLINVNISEIKALAFANVAKMDKIDIINCHIGSVSPKAFSKFIVNTFLIEGSYIGKLPSYAMHSIEVASQFRLENNHFGIIYSRAIRITEPRKFLLRSCRIEVLEGEAIQASTRGQIFIDDNIIEDIRARAFVGIHEDPRALASIGTQEYVLENNTLTKFEENALFLNTSGMKLTLDRLILNKECSCTDIKTWSTKLVVTSTRSSIIFSKQMWCLVGKTDTRIVYDYDQKHCHKVTTRINWILAGPIVSLIILLGLCCLGYWFYKKRSQKYINVNKTNNNRLSAISQDCAILDNVVLPAGKNYVETELNVLTESVEPIKEYVAPHRPLGQEKG